MNVYRFFVLDLLLLCPYILLTFTYYLLVQEANICFFNLFNELDFFLVKRRHIVYHTRQCDRSQDFSQQVCFLWKDCASK